MSHENFYFRTIYIACFIYTFCPNISAIICQVKSFLHFLKSNNVTAVIRICFGKIRVSNFKYQFLSTCNYRYRDKTWFCSTNAMFKGIFNKRNKYKWCHLHVFVSCNIYFEIYLYIVAHSQTHEFDIILYKSHFVF